MPPEPTTHQIREALASEIDRRGTRFHSGPEMTPAVREHVRGELIGLRTALAISLGHPATDGIREAEDFYQQWLKRRPAAQNDTGPSRCPECNRASCANAFGERRCDAL